MSRDPLSNLRRRSKRDVTRKTRRVLSMQTLDDRRVLAAIVGTVFNDANDSLQREAAETSLADRLVFIDQNSNGSIDQGEPYDLTNEEGQFSFDGLTDGTHVVHVFNGTQSQIQTTPSQATASPFLTLDDVTAVTPGLTLDAGTENERDVPMVFAKGTEVHTFAGDGTVGTTLDLGVNIQAIWRAPSGKVFALGDNSSGHKAFVVEADLSDSTPFTDSDLAPSFIAGALDDVGRGVVLSAASGGVSQLWTIDTASLTAEPTSESLSPNTQLVGDSSPRSNDGPTRTILARSAQVDDGNGGTLDGLEIQVWSNASASLLTTDPIFVDGGIEVVAFSDESSLLVVRQADGLTVHDLETTDLATLYGLPDPGHPVAIDAARGLLVTMIPPTVNPVEAGIRLINAESGDMVADLAIDLSLLNLPAVTGVTPLSLDPELRRVAIVGSAGLAELSLRTPTPHRVQIANGVDPEPIEFGMRLIGANTAPDYIVPPTWTMLEDTVLTRPAPAVIGDAIDAEDDDFVLLPIRGTSFGVSNVTIPGSLSYVPIQDFAGVDQFTVWLHDGRDFTESVLDITVENVPDPPTGVVPNIDSVPENIPINTTIGDIDVIDGDGLRNHIIEVDDERFIVDANGNLIFIGPGSLNWEDEWSIPLIFTVYDPDFELPIVHSATVQVLDSDDPITDLSPEIVPLEENSTGGLAAEIAVVDEDEGQSYEITVDDDRFEVVENSLRLKPDVSVDFEAAESIVVNVTATREDDTFTKAITLQVVDVPEVPVDLSLSPQTVQELQPGAIVGDLTIAGNPGANNHTLSVDDSRFEFEGSTLKLVSGVSVLRSEQEEIEVEVTATSLSVGIDPVKETFVIVVIPNNTPFHNDIEPHDVNGDDQVSSLDALTIINYLNTYGPGPVGFGDPAYGYDVNGDGFVTALDALLVINFLNRISDGGAVGNSEDTRDTPEGESIGDGDGPRLAGLEGRDGQFPPGSSGGPGGFATNKNWHDANDSVLSDFAKFMDGGLTDGSTPAHDLAKLLAGETQSNNGDGSSEDEDDDDFGLLSDDTSS